MHEHTHSQKAALAEFRCACGKLLFRGSLTNGDLVEIKCRRCGAMSVFGPQKNTLASLRPA